MTNVHDVNGLDVGVYNVDDNVCNILGFVAGGGVIVVVVAVAVAIDVMIDAVVVL